MDCDALLNLRIRIVLADNVWSAIPHTLKLLKTPVVVGVVNARFMHWCFVVL